MTRIKIAIGAAQIEYEGSQEFIESGLLKLATELFELAGSNKPVTESGSSDDVAGQSMSGISTNTVAQLTEAKTGSDLALAAAAKIILINKKPTATRQDILDEMKEAVTFYKESYASNLSAYLDTLVKNRRLNIVARGVFGLTQSERSKFEQALNMATP